MADSTSNKRQRTDQNEDEFAEGGQGGFATDNIQTINTLWPKYVDINLDIKMVRSGISEEDLKLDFRKFYTFNTWSIAAFRYFNNSQAMPGTVWDNLLDKLEGDQFTINWTRASSKIKFISQHKIVMRTTADTAVKESSPCSQTIIIATPLIRQETYMAEDKMEQPLTWQNYNAMRNYSTIDTYKVGDIATLHQEDYPEQWITLPNKPNEPTKAMNIGEYFNEFTLGDTNGTHAKCQFTLPYDQKYNDGSACHNSQLTASPSSAILNTITDPNYGLSTVHIKERTNDHFFKHIFVLPINDGNDNIQEGYLSYDFERSASLVIRLHNLNGVSPNLRQNRRLANWEQKNPYSTSIREWIKAVTDTFKRNREQTKAFVAPIH